MSSTLKCQYFSFCCDLASDEFFSAETPLLYFRELEGGGLCNAIPQGLAYLKRILPNKAGFQLAVSSRRTFPLHPQ